GAQAIDDGLRAQLVVAVSHHGVVALILTRIEVLRRTQIVRAEHATVVPVGAAEEPIVAAFAQHRVPHAADLRAVHAGAAIGRAADTVDAHAADGVALYRIFTAAVGGMMARLGFETE